jgi:predicted RNase H-like nuclease (RuvC/YqgF family)
LFYGRPRGRGRPINTHTKAKRTEQIYLETIQQAIFMKKPGESIADVISRVFTVYSGKSEESEYYEQQWQDHSQMKLFEEENKRKENIINQLKEENEKLKQLINNYISRQITSNDL